jgi:hypothetical protein
VTDCGDFQNDKPRIILSLNQTGVIILRETGIIYQNQTGGHTCAQRCAEGALVLLTDPYLITDTPTMLYQCSIEAGLKKIDWNRCYFGRFDATCADEIDELLQSNGYTKAISVDRTRLEESEEAWIYVKIKPLEYANYVGFGECDGVLVWANSD